MQKMIRIQTMYEYEELEYLRLYFNYYRRNVYTFEWYEYKYLFKFMSIHAKTKTIIVYQINACLLIASPWILKLIWN